MTGPQALQHAVGMKKKKMLVLMMMHYEQCQHVLHNYREFVYPQINCLLHLRFLLLLGLLLLRLLLPLRLLLLHLHLIYLHPQSHCTRHHR